MTTVATGRVRLWASATDYVDLPRAMLLARDSKPAEVVNDRLGRPHVIRPAGTEGKPLCVSARLVIRSADCYTMNSLGTLNLIAWLRYWLRDNPAAFYAYAYGRGTDPLGTAVHDQQYYKLDNADLGEWLLGLRTGLDGIPRTQELSFSVLDEGTFLDWAIPPTGYTFTILDADPTLDKFKVAGDQTALFTSTTPFTVSGAPTGPPTNNGAFVCSSNATLSGSDTLIPVTTVPANDDSGTITRASIVSRGGRD